jgi:hypothetical protein
MSEQKLDGPEIASPPVDESSFCASQWVRPELPWVQSNAANPIRNKACVLPMLFPTVWKRSEDFDHLPGEKSIKKSRILCLCR